MAQALSQFNTLTFDLGAKPRDEKCDYDKRRELPPIIRALCDLGVKPRDEKCVYDERRELPLPFVLF